MATKRKPVKPNRRPTTALENEAVSRTATPTPTELRAEQEPAVTVGRAGRSRMAEDWAPPPHQPTWWEKLREVFRRKREQREEMAAHMAAVKAGVLQELETMGVKKGVAVKGSPFSSVLLPVKPRPRYGKWGVFAAAVVVLIGVLVWFSGSKNTPEAVLGQAVAAVRNHDLRTFETRVDVASVAASLVNQMFHVPEQGSLAARMTSFAKPGLAEGLKDEILAAVGGAPLDDSGNTLLGKLWQALGGENIRLGAARIAQTQDDMAVAEVPLHRVDLGLTLPLHVTLTRGVDGDWQVSDVTNLAAVMDSLVAAEAMLAERRDRATAEEVAAGARADVRVEAVKKAKDTDTAGSSNLILSMVLANNGTQPADEVKLDVAFGDAAGQPMMTTRLKLDGTLPAGAKREQVWSVPVDRSRAVERYVADLPLTALTVTVTVVP